MHILRAGISHEKCLHMLIFAAAVLQEMQQNTIIVSQIGNLLFNENLFLFTQKTSSTAQSSEINTPQIRSWSEIYSQW